MSVCAVRFVLMNCFVNAFAICVDEVTVFSPESCVFCSNACVGCVCDPSVCLRVHAIW